MTARGPALAVPEAPLAFHVMAKPARAICNLDCEYSFFLSKEMVYPGSRCRMATDLQETYIQQLLEAHARVPGVVMGLRFFRRSVELERKYARRGQRVLSTIPTHGTPLDDAGGEFLRQNEFLAGISVEGLREMRDACRVDKGGTLASWSGEPGGMCVHAKTCGQQRALEHTGDLWFCDHYVEPAYLLGNINDTHLPELVASPAQRKFGRCKYDALTRYCMGCDVRLACNGGCPKERFAASPLRRARPALPAPATRRSSFTSQAPWTPWPCCSARARPRRAAADLRRAGRGATARLRHGRK